MVVLDQTETLTEDIVTDRPALVGLRSDFNGGPLDDIGSQLQDTGYNLSLFHADPLTQWLSSHPQDVLLVSDTDEALAFLKELEQQASYCIRVLFTNTPTPSMLSTADLVLPSVPFHNVYFESAVRALTHNQATYQPEAATAPPIMGERESNDDALIRNVVVRTVSHEMKTPLLLVKASVSGLAEEFPDHWLAQRAIEATARLEGIIQNIMQLSTSLNIKLEPCLPRDIVDLAMRGLRRSWSQRENVERININIEQRLPAVEADKQALGIVVQLLVDNALKFSKKTVDISVNREGEFVVFTVRDAGIGIPKNQIEKIFDVFYQVDSSDKRKYGGAGVGLALVRLILDRHNVQIEVESKPRQGTLFRFRLKPANLQTR